MGELIVDESGETTRSVLLEATCPAELFEELCEENAVDPCDVMERHALDGDAYTLALALGATQFALGAISKIVAALLKARHPVRLTINSKDGEQRVVVSGISVEDLPALGDAIEAIRPEPPSHPADETDGFPPRTEP